MDSSGKKKKRHWPMWQSANPNPHLNLTLTNPNNGRSVGTSVSGHMGLTPFWTVIGSPMKSLTNTWAKSQHCDLPPGRTRKIMTEVNLNEFVHFFRWGLLLNKASVCRLWPWKWETNWKRIDFMIVNENLTYRVDDQYSNSIWWLLFWQSCVKKAYAVMAW